MKLIFVYNADSGLLNTARDIGHKLFSPASYDCFLCSLTHGTFRENPLWREFRQNSTIEMEFHHRDEFEKTYGQVREYPVILQGTESLTAVLDRTELEKITSLEQLIERIRALETEENRRTG